MAIPSRVTKHLTTLKLAAAAVPHRTVFTVYDLAQTLKIKPRDIAKTLLIKADRAFHIVVIPAHRRLDLTAVKKALEAKNVTFGSERDMVKTFKVKPGGMTAFGTLHKIPVLVDRMLLKSDKSLFPGGSFTDSLRMSVKKYVASQGATVANISVAPKK